MMTDDATQYWLLTVSAHPKSLPRNVFHAGLISQWKQDHPDEVILTASAVSKKDYDLDRTPHKSDGFLRRGSDDYRVIQWEPGFSRLVDWLYEQLKDAVTIPCGIMAQIYADHCQDKPLVMLFLETVDRQWYWHVKMDVQLNDSLMESDRAPWVQTTKDKLLQGVESLLCCSAAKGQNES